MQRSAPLAALQSDNFLHSFFSDAFDADAFVRPFLLSDATLDAAESAHARLRQRAADVEDVIKAVVSAHQDDLFTHAGDTEALKTQLASISDAAQGFAQTSARLHEAVLHPYHDLRADTRVLRNVLAGAEVLRRTQRVLYNVKRLRSALGLEDGSSGGAMAQRLTADAGLLTRVGPLLRDITEALRDPSLAGVEVVDAERGWVADALSAARSVNEAAFKRAYDALHATEIASCLALAADMGCAGELALSCIDASGAAITAAAADALDVVAVARAAQAIIEGGAGTSALRSGLLGEAGGSSNSSSAGAAKHGGATGGVLMPPAGAAAAWRGALWARVETLCEAIHRHAVCAWNVAYVASWADASRSSSSAATSSSSSSSSVGGFASGHRAGAGGVAAEGSAAAASSVAAQIAAALGSSGSSSSGATAAGASPGKSRRGGAGGIGPAGGLLVRYWEAVHRALAEEAQLLLASEAAAFVRNTVVEGYPKLHYALLDAVAKAARSVAVRSAQDGPAADAAALSYGGGGDAAAAALAGMAAAAAAGSTAALHFPSGGSGGSSAGASGVALWAHGCRPKRLLAAVAPLQQRYLGRTVARLTEATEALFPPSMTGSGSGGASPAAAAGRAGVWGLTDAEVSRLVQAELGPGGTLEPPPSVSRFVKLVATEVAACRPGPGAFLPNAAPLAAATGLRGGDARGGATAPGGLLDGPDPFLPYLPAGDPWLAAAVCRAIGTAVRSLVARVEACAPAGASTRVLAASGVPTPTQAVLLCWAARLDELRRALAAADAGPTAGAAAAPLPCPAPVAKLLDVAAEGDPALAAVAASRALTRPLGTRLSPRLAAVEWLLNQGAGESLAALAAASAPGHLHAGISALDAAVEALVKPWVTALAGGVAALLAKLVTDVTYTAAPSATAASTPAPAGSPPEESASPAPPPPSEWLVSLEGLLGGAAAEGLSLLPPGHVADTVRAGIAGRVVSLFTRFVCLVRPLDESGRLRLTRDCAQLEAAVSSAWGADLPRLGAPYTALRALRPLLHLSSAELLEAVALLASSPPPAPEAVPARVTKIATVLRSCRPANLLHALLARLPPAAAAMPGGGKGPASYSTALDDAALAAMRAAAAAVGVGGAALSDSARQTEEANAPASSSLFFLLLGGSSSTSYPAGALVLPPGLVTGTPAAGCPGVNAATGSLDLREAGWASVDATVLAGVRECVAGYQARAAGGGEAPEAALLSRYGQWLVQRG